MIRVASTAPPQKVHPSVLMKAVEEKVLLVLGFFDLVLRTEGDGPLPLVLLHRAVCACLPRHYVAQLNAGLFNKIVQDMHAVGMLEVSFKDKTVWLVAEPDPDMLLQHAAELVLAFREHDQAGSSVEEVKAQIRKAADEWGIPSEATYEVDAPAGTYVDGRAR